MPVVTTPCTKAPIAPGSRRRTASQRASSEAKLAAGRSAAAAGTLEAGLVESRRVEDDMAAPRNWNGPERPRVPCWQITDGGATRNLHPVRAGENTSEAHWYLPP